MAARRVRDTLAGLLQNVARQFSLHKLMNVASCKRDKVQISNAF